MFSSRARIPIAIFLLLAGAAPCTAQSAAPTTAQCAAAKAAAKAFVKPGFALSLEAPMPPRTFYSREVLARTGNWFKDQPSAAALGGLYEGEQISVLQCPSVLRLARANDVEIADAALTNEGLGQPPRRKSQFVIQAGVPILAPGGREAVMYVSISARGLGGGSDLVLLRLRHGVWRVTASAMLSVS